MFKKIILILIFICFSLSGFSQGQPSIREYKATTTYRVNDLATKDGVIYKALVQSLGNTPPHADWEANTGDDSNYAKLDAANLFDNLGNKIAGKWEFVAEGPGYTPIGSFGDDTNTLIINAYNDHGLQFIQGESTLSWDFYFGMDSKHYLYLHQTLWKVPEQTLAKLDAEPDDSKALAPVEYVRKFARSETDSVGGIPITNVQTKTVTSRSQNTSYSTADADNGMTIELTPGATSITITDDSSVVTPGFNAFITNHSGLSLTWGYGTLDSDYKKGTSLPVLADGEKAWLYYYGADKWDISIGESGDFVKYTLTKDIQGNGLKIFDIQELHVVNYVTTINGSPPATSTSTGFAGQIIWTADYMYVCIATNSWKRVAYSTWP